MTTTLTVPSHPDRPGYPLAPTPLYSVLGYDAETDEWTIEVATPTTLDQLAALPAAESESIIVAASTLVAHASDLWDHADSLPSNAESRPLADIVTHVALTGIQVLIDAGYFPEDPEDSDGTSSDIDSTDPDGDPGIFARAGHAIQSTFDSTPTAIAATTATATTAAAIAVISPPGTEVALAGIMALAAYPAYRLFRRK